LTSYYYNDKKKELAEMASEYLWGGCWSDLRSKVPAGTNWLKSCKPQMIKCKGWGVLLVLGWCPVQDETIDLDAMPSERGLTKQIVMFIEKFTSKKALFLDFFLVRHLRYSIGIKPRVPIDSLCNGK
jgi:hypothetical protein